MNTCVRCPYWWPDPDMAEGRCHNVYSPQWSTWTKPSQTCSCFTSIHERMLDDRFEEACLTRR